MNPRDFLAWSRSPDAVDAHRRAVDAVHVARFGEVPIESTARRHVENEEALVTIVLAELLLDGVDGTPAPLVPRGREHSTWTLDAVALLLSLAQLEDCWCEGLLDACPPCRARDLIARAPVATPEVDYSTGRRVERVIVAGGRL